MLPEGGERERMVSLSFSNFSNGVNDKGSSLNSAAITKIKFC